jgi:hypothetical protein
MLVLYILHKCPLKIVYKLNSTPLLLKLRALIRGSRTSHVTRPKGARLPYYLTTLSRARDNTSLSELLSLRVYAFLKALYSKLSKYYAFIYNRPLLSSSILSYIPIRVSRTRETTMWTKPSPIRMPLLLLYTLCLASLCF